LIRFTPMQNAHQGYLQALLIQLAVCGVAKPSADIREVADHTGECNDLAVTKDRDGEVGVIEMTSTDPGIVGDEGIAFAHVLDAELLNEVLDRDRHRRDE